MTTHSNSPSDYRDGTNVAAVVSPGTAPVPKSHTDGLVHTAASTAPRWITVWLPLGCLLLLALFPLIAPLFDLGFYVSFVRRVLIYALAASSLNFILGYGGMVALGHAAFFGAGAYVVAMLSAQG